MTSILCITSKIHPCAFVSIFSAMGQFVRPISSILNEEGYTYLVHKATKNFILLPQSLYKPLWSNYTSFSLLRAYLHGETHVSPQEKKRYFWEFVCAEASVKLRSLLI